MHELIHSIEHSFFDSIIQLKIELNTMHEMGEL